PLSSALNGLGEWYRVEGDLEKAEPLYEEALPLSGERGDRRGMAAHLVNLAWTSISLGREGQARAIAREGLAIVEDIGSKQIGIGYLDCSAGLAAAVAGWERAARLHGTAEALREQMGYHREPTDEADRKSTRL